MRRQPKFKPKVELPLGGGQNCGPLPFGSPICEVPTSTKEPKRGHDVENYPHGIYMGLHPLASELLNAGP